MIRLNQNQIEDKIKYVRQYINSFNAADASKLDANANVSSKNIATLEAEINKDINIQINRALVKSKIESLFGVDLANEYIRQIEEHEIYVHDETSLKPYCVSVTMYPLLLDGMKRLGGESKAPKHLSSFCGTFINFVFAISSQFAGAVATVEFLTYFDHFARKEWGEDYLSNHATEVASYLQQVVYSINQPAAARGYQSVFWNISIYDQFYFESLFDGFVFPDGDQPSWNSVRLLQEFFQTWFSKERQKALLTFPVVTVAMLTESGRLKDEKFGIEVARQMANGNSFFVYLSDSPDSLASCCRLRNEISNQGFSYSLGAGGVSTGSINVITLNMNRLVQKGMNLADQVRKIHSYQIAYRRLMEEFKAHGMLPAYDAGFISLDKQYLTIGINGMVEAAEALGIQPSNNKGYIEFVREQLKTIYNLNKEAKKETGLLFNTEFVPAENLGVKNAKWDKEAGLIVNRECYNSYFYPVEDEAIEVFDKFNLHGKELLEFLDGGSALHLNLDEHLDERQYLRLLQYASDRGCNYFCVNVRSTVCNECDHIEQSTQSQCLQCGSSDVDYATRVIGYLKKVSHFSKGRRLEHARRHYHLSPEARSQSIQVISIQDLSS